MALQGEFQFVAVAELSGGPHPRSKDAAMTSTLGIEAASNAVPRNLFDSEVTLSEMHGDPNRRESDRYPPQKEG
jgi:hypothetical protein